MITTKLLGRRSSQESGRVYASRLKIENKKIGCSKSKFTPNLGIKFITIEIRKSN